MAKVEFLEKKADFEACIQGTDKLVVVDFTAKWCGPCKMISPLLDTMSEEMPDVLFVKVDVDKNEETATECGINCMPTFHCYRNGQKVAEMSGASPDKLRAMIEANRGQSQQMQE